MANENLTELHFFGVPTAAFDLFPKGVPVVIRTVIGASLFCILHPDVANLSLLRIADNEFVLLTQHETRVTDDAIQDLALTLIQIEEAGFPVTIRQDTTALGAVSDVSSQVAQRGTAVVEQTASEVAPVTIGTGRTLFVQNEIEVDIG